jgi:hypothetical protein
MWIFTRYGFYSVVCARQGDGSHGQPVDSGRFMVRARVRRHLEALKGRFSELVGACEIHQFSGDYAFRIFVDKPIWSQVLAGLSEEVDYDNFKSEVARFQSSDEYEQSLHDVWEVMRRLQR